MKKYSIIAIAFLFTISSFISAQNFSFIREIADTKDTVVLKLKGYTGDIQWQHSDDSLAWTDIEGEIADSLIVFSCERNKYIRAKVRIGNCNPFYSDITFIESPDIELNIDFVRLSYDTFLLKVIGSIGDIQWQQSLDDKVWTDLKGKKSDSLILIPEEDKYLRVKATIGNCSTYYSNIAFIDAPIDYKKLLASCEGNPVENVGEYDPDNEFHKIVLIRNDGIKHPWDNYIPYDKPSEMNEVELIACISHNWDTSHCAYDNLSVILRLQAVVTISIRVASTGELLESKTFYGSIDACPFTNYSSHTVYGTYVTYDDVKDWLITKIYNPIIVTNRITDITSNSAVVSAEVLREYNSSIIDRGICWSNKSTPSVNDNKISAGSGIGTFSVELTDLNNLTTYYVRAYAISDIGKIYYGEEKSFVAEVKSGTFSDPRDGRSYKYAKIGTQTWMAENLAYLPSVSLPSSVSDIDPYYYVYGYYGNSVEEAKSTSDFELYGVLYNWPAAMNGLEDNSGDSSDVQGVCPQGWHLPSMAEWHTLVDFVSSDGYKGKEGYALKATKGWWPSLENSGIDNYIFSALPGGFLNEVGSFQNIISEGYWWSSTTAKQKPFVESIWLTGYYESVYLWSQLKKCGNSVRCMKD
jgi:uncharacterized protein (TIGR02145 family)